MTDGYPQLAKALREAWEAEQDLEKLRLRRRLQELYGRIRDLERELRVRDQKEAA